MIWDGALTEGIEICRDCREFMVKAHNQPKPEFDYERLEQILDRLLEDKTVEKKRWPF